MTFRKGRLSGKVIKVAALQDSVRPARSQAEVDLPHPLAEVDLPHPLAEPVVGQVAARPSSIHEAGAEVADPRRVQEASRDKELMRSGERSA
jgi:hypothetical protein